MVRERPPRDQLRALLESAGRVDTPGPVAEYLQSRGIDAGRVADLGLAVDRGSSKLWRWEPSSAAHRLLLPLVNARGEVRSVRFRSIDATSRVKSLAPSGYSCAELLLADPVARLILATGQRPAWWSADAELRVVIAEGEPDFLAAAIAGSDAAEHAPATIGIVSGSWTRAIADRIPDGSIVVIATDADEAGDKYAAAIVDSFDGRQVQLERWRAPADQEVA